MKFVVKALVYIVLMNAVMFLGASLLGGNYEFNYLYNFVVPILCAYASWSVERRKAKRIKSA